MTPIELAITELVQSAPDLDRALVDELAGELRRISHAGGAPLAAVIARVLELTADDLVDPGVALPALAMACTTLVGGIGGALTQRELDAARYEIETLLPMPGVPGARLVVPDVPVDKLKRRT